MNHFYIYLYLRDDGTPYYVGKGSGNRAFEMHDKHIHVPREKEMVRFVVIDLSETEAYEFEALLIAEIGRADRSAGPLVNKTDGGTGGCSGRVLSAETKEKIAKANRGKFMSAETRERIGRARKGFKHDEATKVAIRLASIGRNVGRKHTQEELSKMCKPRGSYRKMVGAQ